MFTTFDGVELQTPFELNDEQKIALNFMVAFSLDPKKYNNQITISGNAGSGKTSIVSIFNEYLKKKHIYPYFSSPTHRANAVTKLKNPSVSVYTLHALFGLSPKINLEDGNYTLEKLKFTQTKKKVLEPGDLVIIDESSMVSDVLYDFVEYFKNNHRIKVIYIGDNAQLRPVGSSTISKVFNATNVFQLTKVERTGNSFILEECTNLRNGKKLNYQTKVTNGLGVEYVVGRQNILRLIKDNFTSLEFEKNRLYFRILSAKNEFIQIINQQTRNMLFSNPGQIVVGDILMGYDNFDTNYLTKESKIYNSGDYFVTRVEESVRTIHLFKNPVHFSGYTTILTEIMSSQQKNHTIFIVNINEEYDKLMQYVDYVTHLNVTAAKANEAGDKKEAAKYFSMARDIQTKLAFMKPLYDELGNLKVKKTLDYGYAHSIHKSQGGTYNKVLVLDDTITEPFEPAVQQELKYVAVSRASEYVYIATSHKLQAPIINYKPTMI